MRPSTDHFWKPDADGFDARRVLIPVVIGLAVLFLAAEVYFALARPRYDIRTGSIRLIFMFLAAHLMSRGLPEAHGRLRGRATWLRAVLGSLLLILGNALLILFRPPTWTTFGLGVATLAAAVVVTRIRLNRTPVSGPPAGSA